MQQHVKFMKEKEENHLQLKEERVLALVVHINPHFDVGAWPMHYCDSTEYRL